jgi:peroxiredoxin
MISAFNYSATLNHLVLPSPREREDAEGRLVRSLTYIRFLPLLALFLLSFRPVNSGYSIGSTAADFSLKNTDGKMLSTTMYKNAKGLILVFTCNHCPFAKKYQQRLNELNNKYRAQGFYLLAVSSTDGIALPDDSYENMVARSKQEHYTFPYLYDETQAVAKAFGAVKTPHAFVLQNEKGKWILKYSGAIDDNGGEPEQVTQRYVQDAVEALLHGKTITTSETKSVGCPIKWKNS